MTCKEFLAQLDDLIDGSIPADTRAQLEEHLHHCEHCEVVFNTTRKTIQIYRSNELFDLPDNLRDRLHSAIMARCKKVS
jgi:anti-sigma factor RsiW